MIDGGGNNHQIERTDILKKAADENFENLRKQFATGVQRIRDESDESIDIRTFLRFRSILNWKRIEKANEWCCRQTEEHIRRSVATCEEGVAGRQSQVRNNHPMIAGGQSFFVEGDCGVDHPGSSSLKPTSNGLGKVNFHPSSKMTLFSPGNQRTLRMSV